jgi:hypothetical protein
LAEHSNGSAWSIVASANGNSTSNNLLMGGTAIASNDVWAGRQLQQQRQDLDRALGWPKLVPGGQPEPGNLTNTLNAVTAIPGGNMWAAGSVTNNTNPMQALIINQ